jgi:hypothetical protein
MVKSNIASIHPFFRAHCPSKLVLILKKNKALENASTIFNFFDKIYDQLTLPGIKEQ